jgi:sortase A
MRRAIRTTGTVLMIVGVLAAIWAVVVWRWEDPFTALYTIWKQRGLSAQYARRASDFKPSLGAGSLAAERRGIALEAARYRADSRRGEAIGRIRIPRIGLSIILVNGTDEETLKKGPGRYLHSYMPGENRLVYIAGHRTTYLAPFSHIDAIRPGDSVEIDVPYGTFFYRVVGHRIVKATNLSVLRSPRHEQLELQACHPRFFATDRYIVYAHLRRVVPRGAPPFDL